VFFILIVKVKKYFEYNNIYFYNVLVTVTLS